MSRAYKISLSESVRRQIHVEDGIVASLDILEILPREAMAGLIERELVGLGFTKRGEVLVREDADGIVVSVDPKTYEVTVRIAADRDVALTKDGSTRAYEEVLEQARERLRQDIRADLEREIAEREASLRSDVTAKLEKKLGDLRSELDRVSNRVVVEALKAKAASLGEIQEVSENAETGEVTIRVRV